jgi:DNA-binding NarL/FixJ family response regulator
MGLSRQQARVVELMLRCASQKQIAAALDITEPTLKTYMQRIFVRTGTNSRMDLAMHVFALSHRVNTHELRHPKR